MFWVLSVLIVIVAVLLILIVMVQNSKGGGLAANFSSSNQAMGVRKTTDFLEKATWILAIALLVFSIGASLSISSGRNSTDDTGSSVEDNVINKDIPAETTNLPPSGLPINPVEQTPAQ
jgi:preprotein translocase subunit SecG